MSMPVITASKSSAPHPPLLLKNTREASFSSYLDASEESFVRIHDDKEIDVFDAQKYFNDALNCSPKILPPHHRMRDDSPIKKPALSISSELSWNSRRGLLRRNQQLKKATKKSFLATIGCNCTCADRNSVDIDDDYIRGRFSFPIFGGKNQEKKEDAEKQRVISSPANRMDAIEELKIPCISVEDSDSDASSDLFEIESLYKDNPSEASIEWSVITGSAAELEEVSSTKKVVELKYMHNAVSVAGDAGARRHVTPLTRFHDQSNARIISHRRSAPATAAHLCENY